MSRHNTIVGENINLFSYHHYISTPLLHTILATYSQQLPTPETTPPEEDWHYIQLQSLHCAFLFIHPNIPFPYAHCHATSPSLQHMVHVRKHSHPVYVLFYPFMLNILFDNPISLINNNVGPITHPYYTKQRKGGGGLLIFRDEYRGLNNFSIVSRWELKIFIYAVLNEWFSLNLYSPTLLY